MSRPIFTLPLLFIVSVSYIIAVGDYSGVSAQPPPKQQKKYVPETGTGSEEIGHYNQIFDLLADNAARICNRLVKHVKRSSKRFDPEARCDLFQEVVEEMAVESGNQVINAMSTTHRDLLVWAQKPAYLSKMKAYLKAAAKFAIQRRDPTDQEIKNVLLKDFSQWWLDVGTKQDKGGKNNGLNNLSPQAIRSLRKQGINIPGVDNDEGEEDILLQDGDTEQDRKKLSDLREDEIYSDF